MTKKRTLSKKPQRLFTAWANKFPKINKIRLQFNILILFDQISFSYLRNAPLIGLQPTIGAFSLSTCSFENMMKSGVMYCKRKGGCSIIEPHAHWMLQHFGFWILVSFFPSSNCQILTTCAVMIEHNKVIFAIYIYLVGVHIIE